MFHRGGRKTYLRQKKPKRNGGCSLRPDWDGTVNDLTVHAASPEDILRKQIKHKSKNADAAKRELQARKRGIPVDLMMTPGQINLEMRKLAILRDVLYDHNDLSEVLRRTDETMSSVKDIFHDSSTGKPGNPNVTMMPAKDLSNQFSDSTNYILDDTNDSELRDQSMDDRYSNLLGHSSNQVPAKNSDLIRTPENGKKVSERSALNGTEEVKRSLSRISSVRDDKNKTADESIAISQNITNISKDATKLQGRLNASLVTPCYDDLKSAMTNIANNISAYEERTGQNAKSKMQVADGLSGFTASMLDAVTRLTNYVSDSELKLVQANDTVAQLQEKLAHQTALSDALTLEIMTIVNGVNHNKTHLEEMKKEFIDLNEKNAKSNKENENLKQQVQILHERITVLEETKVAQPTESEIVQSTEELEPVVNEKDSALKSDMVMLLNALKSQNANTVIETKPKPRVNPILMDNGTDEASHTIASVQSHLKHLQLQHDQAQQRMNELTQHIQPKTSNDIHPPINRSENTASLPPQNAPSSLASTQHIQSTGNNTQPPTSLRKTAVLVPPHKAPNPSAGVFTPQLTPPSQMSPPCRDNSPTPTHEMQYNLDFLQSDNESFNLLEPTSDTTSTLSLSQTSSVLSPKIAQHNREIMTGIQKTQISLEDRISELNKQHAEAQNRLQKLVARRRSENRS